MTIMSFHSRETVSLLIVEFRTNFYYRVLKRLKASRKGKFSLEMISSENSHFLLPAAGQVGERRGRDRRGRRSILEEERREETGQEARNGPQGTEILLAGRVRGQAEASKSGGERKF